MTCYFCRDEDGGHPFQKFSKDTWDYRVFLLREAIVRR
jgi:hypothetical protein